MSSPVAIWRSIGSGLTSAGGDGGAAAAGAAAERAAAAELRRVLRQPAAAALVAGLEAPSEAQAARWRLLVALDDSVW